MSDQKSTQLSPEEWKQLCVLNCQQLVNFLSSVPAMGLIEDVPVSGMTADRLVEIENHLVRGKQFLMAWARSRPVGVEQQKEAKVETAQTNGSQPKRRGRPPKVRQNEAVQ